jgi:GDPmannose 4,6-dehydratase
MKKAMISGITGQDGAYLAKLLLDKGYEVHGTFRRTSENAHGRAQFSGMGGQLNLSLCDLLEFSKLFREMERIHLKESTDDYFQRDPMESLDLGKWNRHQRS